MENLQPEFPVTSNGGSDGDAGADCARIAIDADGSRNYVWVKEEPECTDVSGGDGGAGDDHTLKVDIDGCYDPPKEEPEPELSGGDGNGIPIATAMDSYYECSVSKTELKQELATTDGFDDCYKDEPELVTMGGDSDADSGRDVSYDCSHCGISLSTRVFKVEHELRCKVQMKRKELESQVTEVYYCVYCRCPFLSEEYREQHQQRHCLKRPVAKRRRCNGTNFECDKCEFVTKRKQQLETHLLTHNKNDAEWFACTQCSYKTVHKSDMTKHMKIHNNTFSICCPICGKTFRRKLCLDDHLVRQHYDESDEFSKLITSKVYTCNICDRFRTVMKTNFNQHITLTHRKGAGCQKYQCLRCPYSTFSKGSLTMHAKSHAEQKDYQCAACTKQFARKTRLDSHVLSCHSSNADLVKTITSKIHRCQLCSFKNVEITKLKSHVQSKHI